jgi:hypothetical protein
VTILLDLDPEIAHTRRTGEPDRLEREPTEFQHRVRAQYHALAEQFPDRYRIIDASADIETVQASIRAALEPFIENLSALSANDGVPSVPRPSAPCTSDPTTPNSSIPEDGSK